LQVTARDQGGLGRRLLITRNRLKTQQDPKSRLSLMRSEIRILVDLGDLEEALKSCDRLIKEFPDRPRGHSIKADVLCRTGEWHLAEESFQRAASEHLAAGEAEAASRLGTGPLFRLAEARSDHDRCLELSSGSDQLSMILMHRTERRMGRKDGPPPEDDGWLPSRLSQLEMAWAGFRMEQLLETAVQWKSTEPEWRWRFIVEGIEIWNSAGLDGGPWRKPLRDTVCPVLDPRFNREWGSLEK
jgi:hypothetical protein